MSKKARPKSLPDVFETWMDMRSIHDSQLRDQMRKVLADWMDEPRHELQVKENPNPDEGHACARLRLRTAEDGSTTDLYLTQDKNASIVTAFQFNKSRSQLKDKPLLQLARLASGEYFGSSYFRIGFSSDQYHHDFSPGARRRQFEAASRKNAEDLASRIEKLCGNEIAPDDILWQDGLNCRPVFEAAVQFENRKIHSIVHGFVKQLDQNALKLMTDDRNCLMYVYNWLSGHVEDDEAWRKTSAKAPPDIIARRQEAYQQFPALFPAMAAGGRFTNAVDQGAELVQVLQHFLDEKTEKQLSGEIIERIRGLKTRQVDPKFHGTAYNNAHLYHWYKDLPFVDELPRKWWPNKPAHWPRFSSLPGRINPWAELTGRPAKDVVLDFCNLAEDDPDSRLPKRDGQPMPDYLAKLGRGEHHTFPSTEGNTGDFANCLVQQVALPAIFQVAAARGHAWNPEVPDDEQFSPLSQWCSGRLEKLIFKGMTVGKILSASDRWHEKVTFLQTRTNRVPRTSEKTWPALTDISSAPNGVRLECLTSTAKLVEEGDRQHHCVGGYGYQCLYEDKHILSLVMPDGSYRSTLGIKFNPDTKKAEAFQHYGPYNLSDLPEPLRVAAGWLVNGINDGSIAVNSEAIKAANEEREKERLKDRFESLLMKVGFDPRDSDAADNAYRSLRIELMGVLPEPNRQDYFARRGILAFAHDEVDKYEQQNLKTFRVARLQAG